MSGTNKSDPNLEMGERTARSYAVGPDHKAHIELNERTRGHALTGDIKQHLEYGERSTRGYAVSMDNRSKRPTSFKDKPKLEKISKGKIILVYIQLIVILILFAACLYLNFKIVRFPLHKNI
ncbi:hypothetical protein SteCoe_7760 [Stentor coeruleus]|uniref:Uncharacterized protein n=1 Tax=Stentor coeruleus TaxID=5963 RepID=A0A1R2CLT1_9CILI|nr:hypothetical protein SteCoe_7760 [Stentor coeruleus]